MGTPNLFILGAGKCGTTSLYELLRRHPDIQMCDPKEPSFFCSHFQVVRNPIDYFRLFDSERRYRVDASHVYFSNPETPPVLHALFPHAKFLIILRDPRARAHSLYRHMRRALHADGQPIETADSFHDALLLEAMRHRSPEFAATCRHYLWNLLYMRSSCFDDQIARYFALYPREQFLVMTLAEFRNEAERTVQSIADFLGLDRAGFGDGALVANAAPDRAEYDAPSGARMAAFFGDLTARVDQLVGRPLDWSL